MKSRIFLSIRFLYSFFGLCFILASPLVGGAQTKKSKALRRLEQERKELLKKIEASDKKLQQLRVSTKSSEQTLRAVQQQVAQRREVISLLGNEVSGLQARIDTLSGHIGRLRREESALLLRYQAALLQLQRVDTHIDPLIFILSSSSPNQARERQRFLSKYVKAVQQASQALRSTRSEIEVTKAEVGHTHSEKEQLLALREQEKRKLEKEEAVRATEVKSLKGQEKQVAQDLSRQRQRAEALDRQIQRQVEAEIAAAQKRAEELRKKQLAARAKTKPIPTPKGHKGSTPTTPTTPKTPPEEPADERRAATPGGYAMDASERALASSFAQNKGKLPAPIRGSYSLLRTFGVHQHSEHTRVQVSSSGVDYGVHGDSHAYAVFSGVVSRVFVVPGYGTALILRHGNYLTVYANLASLSVGQGARVKTGQALGAIATAPDGSGSRLLHFQLWHERTKLDPLSWVRR
jgi:peptidase, M23/M37 family, putative